MILLCRFHRRFVMLPIALPTTVVPVALPTTIPLPTTVPIPPPLCGVADCTADDRRVGSIAAS